MIAEQRTCLTRPGIDDHQVAFGGTLEQVAQVVQQNSATAEESAAASEELFNQAEILKKQTSQFKLQ